MTYERTIGTTNPGCSKRRFRRLDEYTDRRNHSSFLGDRRNSQSQGEKAGRRAGAIGAAKKRPMRIPAAEALEEPKLPRPAPQVQPAIEQLTQLISKPVERPEPGLAMESLLDYADPEELRRAILHYEILGKPLSLRGPGEQIIGL